MLMGSKKYIQAEDRWPSLPFFDEGKLVSILPPICGVASALPMLVSATRFPAQ
jgi:hypothetical protein